MKMEVRIVLLHSDRTHLSYSWDVVVDLDLLDEPPTQSKVAEAAATGMHYITASLHSFD